MNMKDMNLLLQFAFHLHDSELDIAYTNYCSLYFMVMTGDIRYTFLHLFNHQYWFNVYLIDVPWAN